MDNLAKFYLILLKNFLQLRTAHCTTFALHMKPGINTLIYISKYILSMMRDVSGWCIKNFEWIQQAIIATEPKCWRGCLLGFDGPLHHNQEMVQKSSNKMRNTKVWSVVVVIAIVILLTITCHLHMSGLLGTLLNNFWLRFLKCEALFHGPGSFLSLQTYSWSLRWLKGKPWAPHSPM